MIGAQPCVAVADEDGFQPSAELGVPPQLTPGLIHFRTLMGCPVVQDLPDPGGRWFDL